MRKNSGACDKCKQAFAFSQKTIELLSVYIVVTKIQNWLRFLGEPGFLLPGLLPALPT